MKVAAAIATMLAATFSTASAASVTTLATVARATADSRSVVVVTTTDDVVNGNTSSIAALNRKPGRDGISLREALLAADRTRGSATLYIMFSARLNGKTIEVRSELPPINRDHLTLEGLAPNGAPARITLDGRDARMDKLGELLLVQASEVTVRWLRFNGMDPSRNLASQVVAVQVGQGRIAYPYTPKSIANLQIVDDVFDNSGFDIPYIGSAGGNTGKLADGLMFGGVTTHISGVTISRNTFQYWNNDAVGVLEDSSGDTGNGVVISDNAFMGNEIPIELGIASDAPQLTGTQIIGNTITPSNPGQTTVTGTGGSGITIDSNAHSGTIDQTLIEDNTISGPATLLLIQAAAHGAPPAPPASGDVISNTQIINNVLNPTASGAGGIGLIGGDTTTSPPSRISGVTIENDTVVNEQGNASLFQSVPNGIGASGNQITDVTVRNSILYEPTGTPIFVSAGSNGGGVNLAPDVLTNSLISGPGWSGTNGNISGDPLFVNAAGGDYHLTAGSPAINVGTTVGAPSYDLDGARRDAQPDIGAYEFGAVPRPLLSVIVEQLGGSGTVTSIPAGITCGTACSTGFDPNTSITLTAMPDRGSRFLGWQNGCSGKALCTVILSKARSVTARFGP